MISPVVEKRIERLAAMADELDLVLKEHGWTVYAVKLLGRMRVAAAVLDDEHEDAEECLGDILEKYRQDDMRSELEKWVTTKEGNKVHFNDEGVPDKGNPHVLSVIKDAIVQKEKDEKSGKGKDKKVGNNVSDDYKSPYPIEEISAKGPNKPCVGFTQDGLARHKSSKHAAQYARMTDEQYNQHAINLLKKACGEDIDGYRCSDGSVCRFNKLTGEYAKGFPGGIIKTCFFPTEQGSDPTKIDIDFCRGYFARRKRVESYD